MLQFFLQIQVEQAGEVSKRSNNSFKRGDIHEMRMKLGEWRERFLKNKISPQMRPWIMLLLVIILDYLPNEFERKQALGFYWYSKISSQTSQKSRFIGSHSSWFSCLFNNHRIQISSKIIRSYLDNCSVNLCNWKTYKFLIRYFLVW